MAGSDNTIAWGSPLNNDREVIVSVDRKRRGDVKSGGVRRERSDDSSVRHSETWRLALLHSLNLNWRVWGGCNIRRALQKVKSDTINTPSPIKNILRKPVNTKTVLQHSYWI